VVQFLMTPVLFQSTNSYNPKRSRFYHKTDKIRRILTAVFEEWAKHSTLTFQEITSNDDADIKISFEPKEHLDVDDFPFDDAHGMVLGHAFSPGVGVGGDVHFREEADFDFDVMYDQQPSGTNVWGFYGVALHELGHSLGLDHSDIQDAVMYPRYHSNTGVLMQDDIDGIQHIYGLPQQQVVESTTEQEPVTWIRSSTQVPDIVFPTEDYDDDIPNKCDTSYDAIASMRGELFIFKGIYMWRINDSNGSADASEIIEIRRLWRELPENMKNVDAVFEDSNGMILIFIGKEVFVFSGTSFEYQIRLTHLQFDSSVRKIDAIFRWHYNQQIYILSGDRYWKFYEEPSYQVDVKKYPRLIRSAWRDVYNIDTAFTHREELFFFKGKNFYAFDDHRMRLQRMLPRTSAQYWMRCPQEPAVHRISNRFGDDEEQIGRDFINVRMVEEEDEDMDNIEKWRETESSSIQSPTTAAAATHKSTIITLFVISMILLSN